MITWGCTGMSHDGSLAVFDDNKLVFAAHSERYSRVKNDKRVHPLLLREALQYGEPDKIYFYENPWIKKTRQLYAGQYKLLLKPSPWSHLMDQVGKATTPFVLPRVRYTNHHHSHAAAGYYTSTFTDAAVLVIDSIGEWETVSIWKGTDDNLKKVWKQEYPHSVGLWYSAMTQRIGLKPQEHEYILMGMAALGDPTRLYDIIKKDFIKKMPSVDDPRLLFNHSLHRGCRGWAPALTTEQDYYDIAAAVQRIYEEIFLAFLLCTRKLTGDPLNIVIMGGCALNCSANSLAYKYFEDVWIMPNPGDAGSAIGCVLAHTKQRIDYDTAFLGHDIVGDYPVEEIITELKNNKITAVASGKAEFGPRALGNRSILADPRGHDVKDRVNSIKRREPFRPFAPVILEEFAADYFHGVTGPYMQYTAKCRRPDEFPAIIHYDGTSRVQSVPRGSNSGIRTLLERWYAETGCPMLLNTSLNIKGEPLVNTRADAQRWTDQYGVKVCLPNSGDG